MREIKQLEIELQSNGLDFSASTFVLSEVVLAYLATKYSTTVINWIGNKMTDAVFVEFEQFQGMLDFGVPILCTCLGLKKRRARLL